MELKQELIDQMNDQKGGMKARNDLVESMVDMDENQRISIIEKLIVEFKDRKLALKIGKAYEKKSDAIKKEIESIKKMVMDKAPKKTKTTKVAKKQ